MVTQGRLEDVEEVVVVSLGEALTARELHLERIVHNVALVITTLQEVVVFSTPLQVLVEHVTQTSETSLQTKDLLIDRTILPKGVELSLVKCAQMLTLHRSYKTGVLVGNASML